MGPLGALAVGGSLLVGVGPADAIVPGTNGPIVFEANRDGAGEIYKINPDGSGEVNLTNNPFFDVFPAWSPDGTQVTFSSDRAEALNQDVYVMNPDGSDQTKIFTNGAAAYVWGDSDTGRIAFNSNGIPLGTNPEGDFEIFTMDTDGTDVVQVTNNAVLDSGPMWSPDCNQISYNSLDTTSLDIFRINADRTNRVNLTNAPGIFDAFLAWSPDGQRIVFSSNRDGNFEIYTMDSADGANVVRLTNTAGSEFRPDWGVPARLAFDDAARGDANRVQVTGTLTCDEGDTFLVEVDLTQGATSGSGTARGTCTGSEQTYRLRVTRTAGPGFVPGPAEACGMATKATLGSRTINDEIDLCNEVTITP